MTYTKRLFFALCVLMLFPVFAAAQFYLPGTNPASVRWSFIESPNYRIIYPRGLDSLARSYAMNLEKYRIPVSESVNYAPGEMMSAKMPVVLHAFNANSNGSVAWAPKRMDLYTTPQGYNPEPMPWTTMLSIHESRHVAQMQFGLSHWFRPFKYVFGEMFDGLLSGIYPNRWLLEGDAVVAETALSNSGRGRTADFLNYYRIAFDCGDFRNYDKWAYGSYRYYAPDRYAFGYLLLSNMRYTYDIPDFSGELFRHFAKRPYDLNAKKNVTRRLTGEKNFYTAANYAISVQKQIWDEDMERRAPFLSHTDVGHMVGNYTEYTDNLVIEDNLYSLKESFRKGRRLVRIGPDGKEKVIGTFGSEVGMLYWSPGLDKIIWSETVPDVRWSQKYNSVIRSLDLETGRKRNITHKGKMFNPNPSPTEGHIAVTEYSDDGRSHLTVLNGMTGAKEISFRLPDSLQLVESAWLDHRIYATCVSESGYGIYTLDVSHLNRHDMEHAMHHHAEIPYEPDGSEYEWETVLAPTPVMIFNFGTHDDCLMFTSDRTGTNEMYMMDPEDGKVFRKTSLRYGGADFTFSEDEDWLICSVDDLNGKRLVRINADSLLNEEVDFGTRYRYVIADRLSEQEKRLAASKGHGETDTASVRISEPKKYRKFPNSFNFHSWAPFYFSYDNISNLSYDYFYEMVSLGATGLFQDRLGTLYGQIGYSAHPDPDNRSKWRHSGHLDLTYAGLYPVIEAKIDFNDRAATGTSVINYVYDKAFSMTAMQSAQRSAPNFSGELSVYIPFNFSSGGWSRGLIPQISYSISNDTFDTGIYSADVFRDPETQKNVAVVTGQSTGKKVLQQTLSGALRFYTIMNSAHSEVYPDLGIGIEAGGYTSPGLSEFLTSSAYLYAYGYLPGITGTQGLRLTALYRHQLFRNSAMFAAERVNILPRGLNSQTSLLTYTAGSAAAAKLTAEYAIPFWMGDFRIWRLFYVKRGILTPHFDITLFGKDRLWSAGASLAIEFGNFLKLSFPMQFGVTYSYNGGTLMGRLGNGARHHVAPTFSISF